MATPRKRDYAAEYARRQELASQRGHRSYYEQRIRGGATAKPDAKRPTGETLRQRAGHGKFRAFLRAVGDGAHITVGVNLGQIQRTEDGWENVPVNVYNDDGDEYEFDLPDLTEDELDWLLAELDDRYVSYDPDYDLGALAPR